MAITSTTIELSWTAAIDNVGVTNYKIYEVEPRVNNPIFIKDVGNVLNDTVTGLTPNTSYTFTIKAEDANGNLSDFSNEVTGRTLTS